MPANADGASHSPRITTVSLYGTRAPSTRVRVSDWLTYLNLDARSLNHAGLPNLRPATVLRNLPAVVEGEVRSHWHARRGRDLLILSREASLFSAGRVEEAYLRSAEHSVYDFDDALFEDGGGIRTLYRRPEKCRRAAAAADVVIAGNDYLATWAERHARDVRVIPSCVEPADYEVKSSWALHDPPVIVWLGSPSTEQYVEAIAPQLRVLHERTGARIRLISGARPEPATFSGFVDREVWDLATMPQLLATADIAIAPLDNSPYSRGKCAYKLLQYAAAGLPIVGYPVGANELALKRFDGVAVGPRDHWADVLGSLMNEPDSQRRRRGLAGAAGVRKYYSFSAWASEWTRAVGWTP